MEQEHTIDLLPFVESSLDFFSIIDNQGVYIEVNSTFERILGFKREEMLNQSYIKFIHDDFKEKCIEKIKTLDPQKPSTSLDLMHVTKNNVLIWIDWSIVPISENRLFALGRDITTEKHLTEDIETAIAESERLTKMMIGREQRYTELKQQLQNI